MASAANIPACIARWTPFSLGMLTMLAPSPAIAKPGAHSCLGIAHQPPDGIVFAPHATRLPPSRISRTSGCVLSCWTTSWTEKVASR